MNDTPSLNTDRVLWPETAEPSCADFIFVTEGGGIGINVGGNVVVKPLKEWHALATVRESATAPLPGEIAAIIQDLKEQRSFSPFSKEATDKAAAALQRLAEEVERSNSQNEIVCRQLVNSLDRIAELEAAAIAPLPEEIAGLIALMEGLPPAPWTVGYEEEAREDAEWFVEQTDQRLAIAAEIPSERIARAIAALPAFAAALQRLAEDRAAMKKWALDSDETNDRLRDRIAELEAKLEECAARLEYIQEAEGRDETEMIDEIRALVKDKSE